MEVIEKPLFLYHIVLQNKRIIRMRNWGIPCREVGGYLTETLNAFRGNTCWFGLYRHPFCWYLYSSVTLHIQKAVSYWHYNSHSYEHIKCVFFLHGRCPFLYWNDTSAVRRRSLVYSSNGKVYSLSGEKTTTEVRFWCRLIIRPSLPERPVVLVYIYTHIQQRSWLQVNLY